MKQYKIQLSAGELFEKCIKDYEGWLGKPVSEEDRKRILTELAQEGFETRVAEVIQKKKS